MESGGEHIGVLFGTIPICRRKARRLGELDVCDLYVAAAGGSADGVE